MKLGFGLPHTGTLASPEAIIRVAQRAEELGYDSLWVLDRFLYPEQPQSAYPATPDGSLPENFKTVLDPLHTLSFVAAHTSRIALGTSILVMGYRNPVLLAQSLTTIDVLSGGRLRVGLGQGWSKDEHDAAGVSLKDRAARGDEVIQVLKAMWAADPVEFQGKFFQVPKSIVQPKPVQKPHPPIYLAAYTPGAMKRVAKFADGWMPTGVPIDAMTQMMEGIRGMAQEAGRDSSVLKMVVRANVYVTPQTQGDQRELFHGSLEEIKSDIQATREIGADELFIDPSSSGVATVEGYLELMEQMKEMEEGVQRSVLSFLNSNKIHQQEIAA